MKGARCAVTPVDASSLFSFTNHYTCKAFSSFNYYIVWLSGLQIGLQRPHAFKHSQTYRSVITDKYSESILLMAGCAGCSRVHQRITLLRLLYQHIALNIHLENVCCVYTHKYRTGFLHEYTVYSSYLSDQDLCSLLAAGV